MKKTSPGSSSVYRNQNAQVRAVFERAGSSRKVLCVALDYAKSKHVALICDGNGEILKTAFAVENNSAGIAHLIEQISATARRRKIAKDCIYLGGEDEAAYVANFTAALRDKGYLVVRVNAYEAKENRENLLASTDNLDLLGIAKTLLARRARPTGESTTAAPAYHHLREITRCRRTLVRQQTAASNRIDGVSIDGVISMGSGLAFQQGSSRWGQVSHFNISISMGSSMGSGLAFQHQGHRWGQVSHFNIRGWQIP
jgi:hypothetical protein